MAYILNTFSHGDSIVDHSLSIQQIREELKRSLSISNSSGIFQKLILVRTKDYECNIQPKGNLNQLHEEYHYEKNITN